MISSKTGKVTSLLLLPTVEARDEFSLFGAYLRSPNFRRSGQRLSFLYAARLLEKRGATGRFSPM